MHSCLPPFLQGLAAATGPLDLLSDKAVEARGPAQTASGNNFFCSALGVCAIFSPVSLLPFSAMSLALLSLWPRSGVCVCECVCLLWVCMCLCVCTHVYEAENDPVPTLLSFSLSCS